MSGQTSDGPPVSPPLVFVEDLLAPTLSGDDSHHLRRVLRIRDGDVVTLSDGCGSWRSAVMGDELGQLGPLGSVDRREPSITVAFALIKGERPEFVVQKLTELGVDRMVPFAADRSVVRWSGDRQSKQIVRLRRIAREASMQSRRCWLPEVTEPLSFDEVIDLPGVCAAQRGGERISLENPTVMIGPEGGWSDSELARLPKMVRIGDHVLRAETAAVTAGGLLAAMRAGVLADG